MEKALKVAMEEDSSSKKGSSSKESIEAPPKAKAKSFTKTLKAAIQDDKKADEQAKKDSEKALVKALKAAARKEDEKASSSTQKHGVALIDNPNPSYWKKQNITVLKEQAELRGYRFTDLETKGGGVKSKFKKFKKEDYLNVLLKLLKI